LILDSRFSILSPKEFFYERQKYLVVQAPKTKFTIDECPRTTKATKGVISAPETDWAVFSIRVIVPNRETFVPAPYRPPFFGAIQALAEF